MAVGGQKIVEAYVEIGARTTALDKGLRDAVSKVQAATEKMAASIKKVGDALGAVGKRMTAMITLPFIAAAYGMFRAAEAAYESENLFEVSMGNMADAARKWSMELNKALGLNHYELRRQVGIMNVMFTSMGLGEKAAFDMSKGLVQLAYDMASFFNQRPADVFDKLQSGMVGMGRPLYEFGIIINETTTALYAYENGIAAVGSELTEQQKLLARYGLLLRSTASAQGDLARTADSPENKLRVLGERFKLLAIQLGFLFIPIFERVMPVIEKFVTAIEKSTPEMRQLGLKIAAVAAAAGPLLMIFGALIGIFASFIATASSLANVTLLYVTAGIIGLTASILVHLDVIIRVMQAYRNFRMVLETTGDAFKALKAGMGALRHGGIFKPEPIIMPTTGEFLGYAPGAKPVWKGLLDTAFVALKGQFSSAWEGFQKWLRSKFGGLFDGADAKSGASMPAIPGTPAFDGASADIFDIEGWKEALEEREKLLTDHLKWLEDWQKRARDKVLANVRMEEEALSKQRSRVRFSGIEEIFRQAAVAGAAERFREQDVNLREQRKSNDYLHNLLKESKEHKGFAKLLLEITQQQLQFVNEYA